MASKARKAMKGQKLPEALPHSQVIAHNPEGTVMSGEALSQLFTTWLEGNMKAMQERLTSAEPAHMAAHDLRNLLDRLSREDDELLARAIEQAAHQQINQKFQGEESNHLTAAAIAIKHDAKAIAALRLQFAQWSKVETDQIMLVFLGQESRHNGSAEVLLEGLKLSPNRAFTWRLLFPCAFYWPLSIDSFKQQLWVGNLEFINDAIHDLGHPLPLMELAALQSHNPDQDLFEQCIQRVLTPAELAYALAYGAFQIDFQTDGLPPGSPPQKPRLKLNPLFARSRN